MSGAIVVKMGAREPAYRYQTAVELLMALQPWLPIADWVTFAASLPAEKPAELPKRLTDIQPAVPAKSRIRRMLGL